MSATTCIMYKFIAGYDRRMNADTVLVLDYVRELEKERDKEINLVEAGILYQLTPLTVVAADVGAGIGEDAPTSVHHRVPAFIQ